MFAKLFKKKIREIKDEKHRLWVKWLTEDIHHLPSYASNYPQLVEIINSIPYRTYTKEELNEENDLSDEEFYSHLFELDQDIPQPFYALVEELFQSSQYMAKFLKISQIIIAPIFQYAIRYTYSFEKYLQRANDGDEEAQKVLKHLNCILSITFKFSHTFSKGCPNYAILGHLQASLIFHFSPKLQEAQQLCCHQLHLRQAILF